MSTPGIDTASDPSAAAAPSNTTPAVSDLAGLDLSTPVSAATAYRTLNWMPIPVRFREKNPGTRAWQAQRISPEEINEKFGTAPQNVGVLLGEPSGGLMDVDLDCPQALALAPRFLPATGAIFGRAGKPRSHWIYMAIGPAPRTVKRTDIDGKTCLVELRSTGGQTIFPPSAHKDTGEAIRFDVQGVPAAIDPRQLAAAVDRLAAACLLARHWPTGARHDAALALSGTLLGADWPIEDAEDFVRAVADAAGDDEVEDRVRAVRDTNARIAESKRAWGWPKLRDLIGEDAAKQARNWLGIKRKDAKELVGQGNSPYRATPEGIVYLREKGETVEEELLTNFTAQITADVVEDDGSERTRLLEITCNLRGRTTAVTLPAATFTAMGWPVEHLGASAIVAPGMGTRDRARAAIQHLSGTEIVSRTIYTHTGWRKVEGHGWVFLHAGGAIGPVGPVEGVQTRLEGALALVVLPTPPTGEELTTAVQASLGLLDLAPDRVSVPAYGGLWRSILGSADLGIFIVGPTGVFKTECAALHQQHLGPGMDRLHLPGSWSSTENALEDLLFRAKDIPIVIDDFKPAGTFEDAKLHAKADRVFRAQGNGSGRQRMRADTTLRPPRPPRAMGFGTGEELPRGQSLRARLVICELQQGDIDPAKLSVCQRHAATGLYAQAAAAFIAWLAPRYEAIQARFQGRVLEIRDELSGPHRRTPANLASLLAALEIFLAFAVEATGQEAITTAEAAQLMARCRRALLEVARTQALVQEEIDPVNRYLQLLGAALSNGSAHITSADGERPADPEAWGWRSVPVGMSHEWHARGSQIGWVDDEHLYLEPAAAYKAAQAMAPTGEGITISEITLRRRLSERGMLTMTEERRGKVLARVTLQGARRNVLALEASLVREPAQSAQAAHIPV